MRSRGFASSALFYEEKRARGALFVERHFDCRVGWICRAIRDGALRYVKVVAIRRAPPPRTSLRSSAAIRRAPPPRTSLRSYALCVYSLGLSCFPLSPFLLFHSEHRCARSGVGLLAPHPRQEASPPAPLLLPRFWRGGLGGFFDFLAGMGDGAPSLDRLYQCQYLQRRP